jgi:hypothetical protein
MNVDTALSGLITVTGVVDLNKTHVEKSILKPTLMKRNGSRAIRAMPLVTRSHSLHHREIWRFVFSD